MVLSSPAAISHQVSGSRKHPQFTALLRYSQHIFAFGNLGMLPMPRKIDAFVSQHKEFMKNGK
jgi:hypothetical protein